MSGAEERQPNPKAVKAAEKLAECMVIAQGKQDPALCLKQLKNEHPEAVACLKSKIGLYTRKKWGTKVDDECLGKGNPAACADALAAALQGCPGYFKATPEKGGLLPPPKPTLPEKSGLPIVPLALGVLAAGVTIYLMRKK